VNVAIEMHDSECLAVDLNEAGHGSVLLLAFVHRTSGEPGISPGEGGVQRVRITMEGMVVEGNVGELPAYVYEGSLMVGDCLQNNMVPFPVEYSTSVCLKMMLSDDARVVAVSGKAAAIRSEGEFEHVEDFEGANRSSNDSL
jgi:hypothetical protein